MKNGEILYHIGCRKEDIGRYCLLPGDPDRCEAIAQRFEGPRFTARRREFTTYTGSLEGETVSVTSTGIGGPSAAIAIEELSMLGADTFIRVGTCGGIDLGVRGGDIVIASGAVRQDGTSREYVPIEFPAVADFAVLSALSEAGGKMGARFHIGVVQSKDSFYGQHSPERMPAGMELIYKWEAWKKAGVLASEMEAAALFTVASVLRARCGAVFLAVWNQERTAAGLDDAQTHDMTPAIDTAIEALRILIRRDRETGR